MSRRRLCASGLGAALLLCSGSVFAQAAAEPAAAEATTTEPAAEATATEPAAEAAADDTAAPTGGDEAAQMAPEPAPPEPEDA